MIQFQSILFAVVYAITVFLPLSSDAHVRLISWLFEIPFLSDALFFSIQVGTLLAIFLYFIGDWWLFLKAGLVSLIERRISADFERQQFWLWVIASLPAVLVGIFFHEHAFFKSQAPLLMAIGLTLTGFLVYWLDSAIIQSRELNELGMWDGLFIGIAQVFAWFPGVSQVTAAIAMGRFVAMTREAAVRFSLHLAFPFLCVSTYFKSRSFISSFQLGTEQQTLFIWVFLVTLFVSFVTLRWFMKFIRTKSLAIFAWYQILLGTSVVILSLLLGR